MVFIQQTVISIMRRNPGAARPQGSFFLGVTDESLSRLGVFNQSRGVAVGDLRRSKVSAKQIIMSRISMSKHDAWDFY